MKKIIALMLCAVMLLSLCACEKSEEAPDTDDSVLTIEEAPVDNTEKTKVVDETQDENALLQSSDEFKATAQIIVNVVDTYVNGNKIENSTVGTYAIGSDAIHTVTSDQKVNVEGSIPFTFENGKLVLNGAVGTLKKE